MIKLRATLSFTLLVWTTHVSIISQVLGQTACTSQLSRAMNIDGTDFDVDDVIYVVSNKTDDPAVEWTSMNLYDFMSWEVLDETGCNPYYISFEWLINSGT